MRKMDKTMIDPIRVYFIEDHPVALNGLVGWINDQVEGLKVSGTADSVTKAIKEGIPGNVNVISLDLYIKDSFPIYNLIALKTKYPEVPVVIFTSEDSPLWVQKMMKNGASAYLTKDISGNEYSDTIIRVANGEKIMPKKLLKGSSFNADNLLQLSPDILDEKQQSFISGIINGKTYKEIADEMASSEAAVDKRFARLRQKYNAGNNVQLILKILKLA